MTIRVGSRVTYSRNYLASNTVHPKRLLTGTAAKIVPTSPALVYVAWNDGSYRTASACHLELAAEHLDP